MTTLQHITNTGGYNDYDNGGVWVDGAKTSTPFQGAVFPLSYKELNYGQGGTYTLDDRKLYTYNAFNDGEKVESEGLAYTIKQAKDYSRFGGGLRIYIMKRGDTQ